MEEMRLSDWPGLLPQLVSIVATGVGQGLAGIFVAFLFVPVLARHVIGCYFTQETRVQNVIQTRVDDGAGTVFSGP